MQTTSNSIKVYVDVRVEFRADGTMLPREITWEDGHKYTIDRVKGIKRAAALRAGGQGDRYSIVVNGQQSFIFFEHSTNQADFKIGRWFVERRVA